jgi:predicted regulator of Ras-like GTPase activity (Roadblock/LC7/MglB family)
LSVEQIPSLERKLGMSESLRNWDVSEADMVEVLGLFRSVILGYPQILGAALVTFDGCLLVQQLPEDFDAKSMVEHSLQSFEATQDIVGQLHHGRLLEMIFVTEQGFLTINDCGAGLLATYGQDFTLSD